MCGIFSQTIRRKLLGQADLRLQKAADIAVEMELTNKEITQISNDKQVHKVEFQECFDHHPDKCFDKGSERHTCKKRGHINPKCPQRNPGSPSLYLSSISPFFYMYLL